MAAIRTAVVDFNRVPPEALADHRARLQLILGEPDLIARSLLKFQGWRQAIAEFVAQRLQEPVDAFVPQLLGEVSLGTAVAAYRQWLSRPEADLGVLLEAAFDAVAHAELLEEHAARGTN